MNVLAKNAGWTVDRRWAWASAPALGVALGYASVGLAVGAAAGIAAGFVARR